LSFPHCSSCFPRCFFFLPSSSPFFDQGEFFFFCLTIYVPRQGPLKTSVIQVGVRVFRASSQTPSQPCNAYWSFSFFVFFAQDPAVSTHFFFYNRGCVRIHPFVLFYPAPRLCDLLHFCVVLVQTGPHFGLRWRSLSESLRPQLNPPLFTWVFVFQGIPVRAPAEATSCKFCRLVIVFLLPPVLLFFLWARGVYSFLWSY